MKVRVWGTRGSLASPGPRTVRYGGNTSCVGVTLGDGTPVALDAGSGIRDLGVVIGASPEGPVHVWAPPSTTLTLEERVATYLSPPLFPIHLTDIPSNVVSHDSPLEPFAIG